MSTAYTDLSESLLLTLPVDVIPLLPLSRLCLKSAMTTR
ncbi:hypothetical protein EVA_12590 [gut metagenome]|uniref:Uncharacterized protein n=1 Tax=gut metagenome TaxID=749906 RepID=J9FXL8_9ZZZZ